jgi:hypothetical protein
VYVGSFAKPEEIKEIILNYEECKRDDPRRRIMVKGLLVAN